jgi:tetratricopeptide (TPR) repeat protein/CHAT domain-containing protein
MRSLQPHFCTIALLTTLILLGSSVSAGRAQEEDEAALRRVAHSYVDAIARRDLRAMMSLWSLRSREMARRLEALLQIFEKGDVGLTTPKISDINIRDSRATLRLSSNLSTKVTPNETSTEAFERNLSLVKEQGIWRISSDVPASQSVDNFLVRGVEWRTSGSVSLEEQFAAALMDATADDRRVLLTDNPEMVTVKLKDELLKQADILLRNKILNKALDGYLLAQGIAQRFADKSGMATAQLGIAATRRASNNLTQSLQAFETARQLFEELLDRPKLGVVYREIAKTHTQMQELDKALESYSKALLVFERINDRARAAETMEDQSAIYYEQGKFTDALRLLERCLRLREAAGRQAEVVGTLRNLGNLHYYQERYESAIGYYIRAVAGFEALKNSSELAETMSYLASASYAVGNYDVALENYSKALILQKRNQNDRAAASSYFGLGSTYMALGDFANGLTYLNKNRSILERLNDTSKVVDTVRLIGVAHVKLRNFDDAREAYERALTIYEESGDKQNAAELLLEIGSVDFARQNLDSAAARFNSALSYNEQLKNKAGIASSYNALGGVEYARRTFDSALDLFNKSLELYQFLEDKTAIAGTLENIAGVNFARGDYVKSLEFADRSAAIATDAKSETVLWKARYTAGIAHRELNRATEARKALEESISIIERLRSQVIDKANEPPFFQDKNDPYFAMIELLLAQNDAITAFSLAEQVKSHSVWDTLRPIRLRIDRGMSPQQKRQEQQLHKNLVSISRTAERQKQLNNPVVSLPQFQRDKQQVAQSEAQTRRLDGQVRRARADYESFKRRVYTIRPELRSLRGEDPPLRGEEAGRILDRNSALLSFVVTDARTFLFVTTIDGKAPGRGETNLRAYVINLSRVELTTQVADFRKQIQDRGAGFQLLARGLYESLLATAGDQLKGKRLLLISPDAVLWGLPFQALQTANDRYLIEDVEVMYVPSATAYASVRKMPPSGGARAAGLQMISFNTPQLSDESLLRVSLFDKNWKVSSSKFDDGRFHDLSRLYGEQRVRVYSGANASEENIKANTQNCRILVLNAPVLLSDSSPLHSPLLIARSKSDSKEDGWFQPWEIVGLKFRANLVLVPRSEVTTRPRSTGDSVTGFSWPWFANGTSTVVLSQWNVDSDESDFLLEWHRHLQKHLPTTSLRNASLTALKSESSHPYYWARFMVLGRGQ